MIRIENARETINKKEQNKIRFSCLVSVPSMCDCLSVCVYIVLFNYLATRPGLASSALTSFEPGPGPEPEPSLSVGLLALHS